MIRSLLRTSIFASLVLFVTILLSSPDAMAQIKLSWDPEMDPDIGGYKVYYGTASGRYGGPIDIGNVTTYTLNGLAQGVIYYIALTAYDTSGNESGYSNEVSGQISQSQNPGNPPSAAGLVAPAGNIQTSLPTYTWNAVYGSTWYYLWVKDSTGTRIQQWYTAAEAGCSLGTGICSVAPTTALSAGPATWWVQTWIDGGFGPRSSPMSLRVAL